VGKGLTGGHGGGGLTCGDGHGGDGGSQGLPVVGLSLGLGRGSRSVSRWRRVWNSILGVANLSP